MLEPLQMRAPSKRWLALASIIVVSTVSLAWTFTRLHRIGKIEKQESGVRSRESEENRRRDERTRDERTRDERTRDERTRCRRLPFHSDFGLLTSVLFRHHDDRAREFVVPALLARVPEDPEKAEKKDGHR